MVSASGRKCGGIDIGFISAYEANATVFLSRVSVFGMGCFRGLVSFLLWFSPKGCRLGRVFLFFDLSGDAAVCDDG